MLLARSHTSPSGSSPQVRGRRGRISGARGEAGLIPAGAGQTSDLNLIDEPWAGSSPQVRGRLKTAFTSLIAARLIPAGAGQTGYAPRRSDK